MATLGSTLPACSRSLASLLSEPDYRLEIGSARFEVAKNKFLKTIAYNQQVPGPVLRLKQGREVTVDITNRTTRPEVVHWHGLKLPVGIDGAMEEGTPMIGPGATTRVQFAPEQTGLRWYHTHTMAGANLGLGQYSGQHGLLLVDPQGTDPTVYDKEVMLVLHDWDGEFAGGDDGTMQPNYNYSTINGRTEAFNEPVRVKAGEKVLFHVLNASATDVHWLAFSGHQFQVIALDGNDLLKPRTVSMLRLSPAERVTAIVTMDNPGKWVLAEPRKHIRAAGMGIVVEYANATGAPRFDQPEELAWHYADFAEATTKDDSGEPDEVIPIVIESRFHGHGSPEQWLLNGYSYPQPNAPTLTEGKRYRLRFDNRSMDNHPMHLHRHDFRIVSIAGKKFRGPLKDTVLVESKTIVEVDFTADNKGPSLLHCHQQDHMDHGFMMVLRYA
jgi:FtsP/CotA-like multicopper oxidase with cupredoxin domain